MQLIVEDTVVCPAEQGATALMMLELFERVAGVPFTEFPGALFKSRVAAIAKVLSNISREAPPTLQPPLLPQSRRGI